MDNRKTCTIENGMSDFHKPKTISLQLQTLQEIPKQQFYRDYETFDKNSFNSDLKSKLSSMVHNIYCILLSEIFSLTF